MLTPSLYRPLWPSSSTACCSLTPRTTRWVTQKSIWAENTSACDIVTSFFPQNNDITFKIPYFTLLSPPFRGAVQRLCCAMMLIYFLFACVCVFVHDPSFSIMLISVLPLFFPSFLIFPSKNIPSSPLFLLAPLFFCFFLSLTNHHSFENVEDCFNVRYSIRTSLQW